ncbi:hypothetical protein [uncultured Gimesia sp.]|uniref:hypothetical protein n=1 Tax=uncultured Gimesia sp. TaxID=1678688 RepID=UPI0030D9DA0C|tara:strand:- start:8392 stop:9285 length:894 start_codon:yes stop_codon:yes gene_type:complete
MTERRQNSQGWECVKSEGPPPFVTHRLFRHADGSIREWLSRKHRKGLMARELGLTEAVGKLLIRCLWMPRELNWWIGSVFALGASLFAIASILSLAPDLAAALSLAPSQVNAIYFAGSIPFTTAAYLQLFQAANSGALPDEDREPPGRLKVFGWKPDNVGWLSCALQFAGTILFNFNTFDAMLPSLSWFDTDLVVWIPNFVGSILFLASGYLAFIETGHQYWAWRPGNLSWWIVLINLLGCLGFMISALLALTLPEPTAPWRDTLSVTFTLQGAICFFLGAVLMLPETVREEAVSQG